MNNDYYQVTVRRGGMFQSLVLVNGDAENDDDHFWKKLKCKQEPMIINNHDNFGFEDFLMFLIC